MTAGEGALESQPSAPASVTTLPLNSAGDLTFGALRTRATNNSIGFEWNVGGDSDHDATAEVSFRQVGAPAWRQAQPLMRIDFGGKNLLAGSVLFLVPGAEYEVQLKGSDPDGGAHTRLEVVKTRPLPSLPTGGRTFHVTPGSGGGDGSASNPFKGVAIAHAAAKPGDVMLLHAGRYGGRITFSAAGQPGRHVAWKAAGDGEPVFDGVEIAASHMTLEGVKVVVGGGYSFPIGVRSKNAPKDVALVRNTLIEAQNVIYLTGGGSDWYIADNVIVGTNHPSSGSFSGEGVELNHTSGHVVAHNRISMVGDGVSYCDSDCDIFGNDIFDTSDDGVEPDGGFSNIRIWNNRMHNTGYNAVSFQPMGRGPWYVIRNQIIGNSENFFSRK